MATWEDTSIEQQAARVAPHWSLLVGMACVLMLSAGSLAAGRLPALLQPQAAGPIEAGRGAHSIPLRAIPVTAPQYVVVFGTFGSRQEAAGYARLVRSKGYIADVVASGGAFRVISRTYESVERALFWTTVFDQIGLDTDTTADLHDLES